MQLPSSLMIALDRRSKLPLQDQLADGIRARIRDGRLGAGDRLPSTRELAGELEISRNTVIAAYERLLGEGYLESRLRSGIHVSPGLDPFLPRDAQKPTVPDPPPRPGPVEPLVGPRPFRPCQPDVRLFPLALWNRMRNRALKQQGAGLLHYQSRHALGLPALRMALAGYLRTSRGVRCDWQQIAVTGGSQQALFLLAQLLLRSGDRVGVEDPGYPGARAACERAGAKLVPLPVDGQGWIPDGKPRSLKWIYTTPSRQFPTGACLPVARRMAMLEQARRLGAWVLEDDYDSEFRYARPPLPSLHSLDPEGRVIYLGSMSKILFPSLRIGYAVLPPELVGPFEALRWVVDDHGPLVDQATLARFLSSGAFLTHIRRCRKTYAARLEAFLEATRKAGLPLEFPHTDGGMNQTGLFLDRQTDDAAISRRLEREGWDVPPLSRYGLRPGSFRPGLVFGFTAFDPRCIRQAVSQMARLIVAAG